MAVSLSKKTAQKIVNTVKDVCGYDINFINPNGIIFASTDISRIGNYHEIAKRAAESKKTIEVESDDSFYGTHKGVNIPFIYDRELIAVIGISGSPSKVRQYAILAQKISSLILREQELDYLKFGKKNQMNYVIRALIEGENLDETQVKELLDETGENIKEFYRVILVRLGERYHPANLSMIEDQIFQAFDFAKGHLYTFQYPNEYVLILREADYGLWKHVFRRLAEKYENILMVGIGNAATLWRQRQSYQEALQALSSLTGKQNYACYENLDLEILLGCIPKNIREEYQKKILSGLREGDIKLLDTYFECGCSLKETAERLFIHKNTLQYQLARIERLTGADPRRFQEAVKLYLGLKIIQ